MANIGEYLGPALSNVGSNVSQFASDQEKLRQQLAQMTLMRQQTILENQRQAQQLAIQQAQEDRAKTEFSETNPVNAATSKLQVDALNNAPPINTLDTSTSPDASKMSLPIQLKRATQLAKIYGPTPVIGPRYQAALTDLLTQTKQSLDDARNNEIDPSTITAKNPKGLTWAQQNEALTPGDLPGAANLGARFVSAHPEVDYLPGTNDKTASDLYKSSFVPKAQPNMATITMNGLNPIANSRTQASIRSDVKDLRTKYNSVAQPYLAMQGIANSTAWGNGVGDINALKQMAKIENGGKSPTDADLRYMAKNIGIEDLPDLLSGKIEASALMTQKVRDAMMSDIEEQTKLAHSGYTSSLQELADESKANGIDPKTVIVPGGNYHLVDSTLSAHAANPNKNTGGNYPQSWNSDQSIHGPSDFDQLKSGQGYWFNGQHGVKP